MDLKQLEQVYEWVHNNLDQLDAAYKSLTNEQVINLPFVLYCIAMYHKHSALN